MIGIGVTMAVVLVGYIVCIMIAQKVAERNPNYDISTNAVSEIFRLMQAGNLPGIVRGERITLKESGFVLSEKTITYPVQRTFEVHKVEDEEYIYKYMLSKSTPDQPWNLKQAWKENRSGKIVDLGRSE